MSLKTVGQKQIRVGHDRNELVGIHCASRTPCMRERVQASAWVTLCLAAWCTRDTWGTSMQQLRRESAWEPWAGGGHACGKKGKGHGWWEKAGR